MPCGKNGFASNSPAEINMDAEHTFQAYCEKKLAMKKRAYNVLSETGAVHRDWTCDECGSTLSWDSADARQKHRRSAKHTQKAKSHIPK